MNKNFINNCKNKAKSLILEKLIIGVEEPIFINGIGKILAKVDSGNSAYNVIHGEDFYYQGETLVFTTYDESGRPHKLSKKVQDKIIINIGAGHTEERPIILLDVRFANEEYINVPFSVGNRADNKNKVLLGKEFLAKELDALIDVTKKKISSKGIDVKVNFKNKQKKKQLNEDTSVDNENNLTGGNRPLPSTQKRNISGAASTAKKLFQKGYGISKGILDTAKTLSTVNIDAIDAKNRIANAWAEAKKIIENYQETDKYLIFKALNAQFMNDADPIIPFIKNPQVFKILDYYGTDYKEQNNIKQNLSDNPKDKEQVQTDESIKFKNNIIIEANNVSEWERAKKDVRDSLRPILYLVIYDGDQVDIVRNILQQKYNNIKSDFSNLTNNIKETFDTNIIQNVIYKIRQDLKSNDILYTFALCEGRGKDRKVKFLTPLKQENQNLNFLNESVIKYKDSLISDKSLLKTLSGTFYANKYFGYKVWHESHNTLNENNFSFNIKDTINEWINDPEYTNKGYNLPKAYADYLKNKGEYNSTNSNNTIQNNIDDSEKINSEINDTIERSKDIADKKGVKIDRDELKKFAINQIRLGNNSEDSAKLIEAGIEAKKLDKNGFGPKTKTVKNNIQYIHDILNSNKELSDKQLLALGADIIKNFDNDFYKNFIRKSNSKKTKNLYYVYDFNDKVFKPIKIDIAKNKETGKNKITNISKGSNNWFTPIIKDKNIFKESKFITNCIKYKKLF